MRIFSSLGLFVLASTAVADNHGKHGHKKHHHHGKRGLAYNDASLLHLFQGSDHITWRYDWSCWSSGLKDGLHYVPMLWGTGYTFTQYWNAAVQQSLANGATHLLSFNEPDYQYQANLSPLAAAQGYMKYMQPWAGKAKLGSPAVTNGPPPMGLAWLKQFFAECHKLGCHIDFVPVHWYSPSSQTEDLKNHLRGASHIAGGKPVWLTEFGTTDGNETPFLETVMPWMDSQDFVHRYSYFMVSNGLLVSGGQPSSYGWTYRNFARKGN